MPKTPPQPVPNTASIKLPDWLPELGKKEEGRRLAAGLIPKKDGWYKTKFGKTRYVCKPCPVAAADLLIWHNAPCRSIAKRVFSARPEAIQLLRDKLAEGDRPGWNPLKDRPILIQGSYAKHPEANST